MGGAAAARCRNFGVRCANAPCGILPVPRDPFWWAPGMGQLTAAALVRHDRCRRSRGQRPYTIAHRTGRAPKPRTVVPSPEVVYRTTGTVKALSRVGGAGPRTRTLPVIGHPGRWVCPDQLGTATIFGDRGCRGQPGGGRGHRDPEPCVPRGPTTVETDP